MAENSDSQLPFIQLLIRRAKSRPQLFLALLTLAALVPFIAKAFNIDEPLFLWAAKHIQSNPANPYNFMVNWYGSPMPMWEVTKNPPMACYYLALAASVMGWSEMALHCAFLIPAIAVILGTYRLARQLCEHPLFAATTTLFTPVFLVSSTSVMCDTSMLAFWTWSVVLWVEGMKKEDFGRLIGSAFLMTLAAYTKYFGICLIPLLAAYSIIKMRRPGLWAICFVIPLAGLAVYQWITFRLYGKGLLGDAGQYATQTNPFHLSQILPSTLLALAFTGGCAAVATFLTPWLWRRRTLAILGLITLLVALPFFTGSFWDRYYFVKAVTHRWMELEVVIWAIGGLSVLALAVADVWQRRDAESCLLALWVFGTFLFAGFCNWTVNARSILPMAPAVAILLTRRLSPKFREGKFPSSVAICSVAAAVLALLVTWADYNFAQTSRRSVQETLAQYGHRTGALWFMGHWGWQYYMEQLGVKALDVQQKPAPNGDFLALPINNVNTVELNEKLLHLRETLVINHGQWISTVSGSIGAGFYSSVWGPVPFAFGSVPPERVKIFVIDSTPSTTPPKQP